MRSPFPGMDPYLEDPIGWPGVHHLLLSSIHELLASAVGPSYVVRVEERDYVTDPFNDPGYAVLVPVVIEPLLEPEIHDRTIEIRDARSHAVVAAIELLSPANKVANSRGRLAMLKKRTLLRQAHAHWMEIDLLRAGERDPDVAGRGDYCVALWPGNDTKLYAWFVDLRDRLPVVTVPLREPDQHVLLDLQQALSTMYQRARLGQTVDYTGPVPAPSLAPPDQAWVQRTIAAWREQPAVG